MMPLAYLSECHSGIVTDIRGGRGLINRLTAMGLTPGTIVHVLKSGGPGPLLIEVRDTRIALGRGVAMKIYVRGV